MNIIITMAGSGSRFLNAGFNVPKFMISANGKTLFQLSMESLFDYLPHTNKIVFVTRVEHAAVEFVSSNCERMGIKNYKIVEINAQMTDGQATTAKIGAQFIPLDESLLIYNIDTYIEPGTLKFRRLKGAGHIPCFCAKGGHWSFVRGNRGIATEVAEKIRISNNCSIGAYYFSSARLFLSTYDAFFLHSKTSGEKFIAPMYNHLINSGLRVTYSRIPSRKVHVLGTPEELTEYLEMANEKPAEKLC